MTADRSVHPPVHPDIIKDLLPLYLAGEARDATRTLVEERLAADPDLARLAREAGAPAALPTAAEPLPPSVEKRALDATRRRLRLRSWLFGGALFVTLLPFSAAGDDDGVKFFLLRDAPVAAAALTAAAAALWFAYAVVSRRLRVTGL